MDRVSLMQDGLGEWWAEVLIAEDATRQPVAATCMFHLAAVDRADAERKMRLIGKALVEAEVQDGMVCP